MRRFAARVLVTVVAVSGLAVGGAVSASAQSWAVEGEQTPSTFDCEHLYHSNFRSGMQSRNDAAGDATIQNTVISKRVGSGLPDYWSTTMAIGKDMAPGTTTVWTRGENLTPVPADDPVFRGSSLVPDLFVDNDGGAYYGIVYGGALYKVDPRTGASVQVPGGNAQNNQVGRITSPTR
ncbi:hypothetical protein ALI144C_41995 [Actinosynnema sp. ALI-1.44]|uniref:hypothetical protein n=1 Tax=Actinosynnema sp. ALI-1.44 TaxID=1933779 RepID=UPI00097CA477|nr:hypothetical protein [Actinosynnema sp. ALI-1.44]ONI72603.1 hypothetical protein ALI144C_41995 [Actinosynnema sp. ALI-1.44]